MLKVATGGFRDTAGRRWRELVDSYSQLQFTVTSDRLVALAGLATKVAQCRPMFHDTYAVGVWKSTLFKDLMWFVSTPGTVNRSGAENVPSWSWAAVDGPVSFVESVPPPEMLRHTALQLRNVVEHTSQHGTPAFKPRLLVWGLLVPVQVSQARYYAWQGLGFHSGVRFAAVSPMNGVPPCPVVYDTVNPSQVPGNHAVFLLAESSRGNIGLLLREVGKGDMVMPACFERVGLVNSLDGNGIREWSDTDSMWGYRPSKINRAKQPWRTLKRQAKLRMFQIV